MVRIASTPDKDTILAMGQPMNGRIHTVAALLAGVAIVSSAFHFWPFENSSAWQILCPANMAVLIWSVVLAGYILLKRGRWTGASLLPHLGVFAYLCINALSAAFAPDLSRTISFTIKLAIMLVGGYALFSSAISSTGSLQMVYRLTIATVMISVSYCLIARFGFKSGNFGFYGNAYKYGTYVGMLAPLCGAYLFLSTRVLKRLLGATLVTGALISSGSLGAVMAIAAGMAAAAIVTPGWSVRVWIIGCLVCGVGLLTLLGSSSAVAPLSNDITLAEKDGINLKQRYIEWQAEINLMEERSITGTAAGCINEYRSNFYYRLPKLNTLGAFDQNGWLAMGAETGIVGLVCFCWIVAYYFKLAYAQAVAAIHDKPRTARRFAVANFAGLIAASIANLFSSVHYNGVLITFVLVLALISRTKLLFGRVVNADNKIH
jgi:hypothetical protein